VNTSFTALLIGAAFMIALLAEFSFASETTSWALLFSLPILLAALRFPPPAVAGIAVVSVSIFVLASWFSASPQSGVIAVNAAGLLVIGALGALIARDHDRLRAAKDRLAARDREFGQRISELTDREQLLHATLDQTPVTAFGQDERLRYTWVLNPPESWGGESLVGRSDQEVFAADQAERLREMKRSVLLHGTNLRHEIELGANGQTRTYDLSLQPLRARDRTIIGVAGAAVDVSQWAETRDRLRDRLELERAARSRAEAEQSRLRKLYERVHRFVASVAHELSQPLTTILGAAQRLERAARARLRDSDLRLVRMISDAAHRANRMLRDLRAASTIETGHFDVHPAPMDLVDAVRHVVDEQPESDRNRIVLDAAGPLTGVWDRDRIMQVVSNLLSNAVKYSPAESEVKVRITREGPNALLSVRDQGPGIAPEDQVRLFEPYTRLEATTSVEGSGLGLYVARRIVEAHGGRIWVESAPGRGATFHVLLPSERPETRQAPER
jgi:signal transduction histidine kinase